MQKDDEKKELDRPSVTLIEQNRISFGTLLKQSFRNRR